MATRASRARDLDELAVSVIADRLRGLSEMCHALYLGYDEAIAGPGLDPARMFFVLSEDLSDLATELHEEDA